MAVGSGARIAMFQRACWFAVLGGAWAQRGTTCLDSLDDCEQDSCCAMARRHRASLAPFQATPLSGRWYYTSRVKHNSSIDRIERGRVLVSLSRVRTSSLSRVSDSDFGQRCEIARDQHDCVGPQRGVSSRRRLHQSQIFNGLARVSQDGSDYTYAESTEGVTRSILTSHCPNHNYYSLTPNFPFKEDTTYAIPLHPRAESA